jgi:uncharacterized membrane protein (DUF485 family)
MQTKLRSTIETFLNVGSGAFISWLITITFLPWYLGVDISPHIAFDLTIIYTFVSMVRSYVWRRVFNWRVDF